MITFFPSSLKKHWTASKEYVFHLGLTKNYNIHWNDYSNFELDSGKIEDFKYCLIQIER